MQTNIIVKLQVEGTHNWPDATDGAGAEIDICVILMLVKKLCTMIEMLNL